MASGNTIPTVARNTCKHPGCGELAAPASGRGRPPEYCEGRGHTEVTAWRERRRLAAAEAGAATSPADTDSPMTMAKVTGAELLRALRAEADRISGIADRLRQAVETVTDPTAAEAEVEAIRAAAEQRAAAAEARAAAAKQRITEAGQWRADAEAAAEEMAVQMDAAQARTTQAEAARDAAEADRDAAIGQAREDAAAEADRDAAVEQARAETGQQVRAAEAERDEALARAAQANRPPGWRSRMPPARRRLSKPPEPRPDGSAPMRRRCWPVSALTPPVIATSCASTCGPGPSMLNSRPTPTATNSPSYAPRPATTPTPQAAGHPGAPGKLPSRNAPRACGERLAVHPREGIRGEVFVASCAFEPVVPTAVKRPNGPL